MKLLKSLTRLCLAILICYLLFLNSRLYYQPSFSSGLSAESYNIDVYEQLLFLKDQLRNKEAGNRMQQIFPEGFVFINSLYALTWTNLIEHIEENEDLIYEARNEINWSLEEINSGAAQKRFPKNLTLQYGAFYRGWSNYVLGKKLAISSAGARKPADIQSFKENCNNIALAMENNLGPYLESYDHQTWPADMLVCVASLKLHDELFNPQYEKVITDWVVLVKTRLDPVTGLIPHRVYANSGKTLEGAQGSSQSLMLFFLNQIDEEFAHDQFKIYKKLFLDYRFGLPGIREYPKGIKGFGHIDSGPIIFQIGGAASVVGQLTMGVFNESDAYVGLRNSIEAFGMGMTIKEKKRYLFGMMPMADAFMAWSNSHDSMKTVSAKQGWRSSFQWISLIIICFLLILIFKL